MLNTPAIRPSIPFALGCLGGWICLGPRPVVPWPIPAQSAGGAEAPVWTEMGKTFHLCTIVRRTLF